MVEKKEKKYQIYKEGVFVGLQLLDGTKVFGIIDTFDNYFLYIDDGITIIDVPRDIVRRIFAVVK